MEIAGIQDPSRCYFADDSAMNVIAAQKLGWKAALVHPEKDGATPHVPTIFDLPKVFPELFSSFS